MLIIYSILIFGRSFGQEKDGEKNPIKLDKYDINQFIATSGSSPQNIINLDNNADILLACISGKSIDDIKSMKIDFTESQIRLLKDWRLLKEENNTLKTTFPILNAEKTKRLRNYSKNISSPLGQYLKDDIINLTKELKSIGREKNIYSILFSYVLDGLVWDLFIERNKLNKREITNEKPFWSGVVWASYPPRDFSCGTNSISDQGVSLNVNWSEKTIKKMIPFVADWENFGKMFDDYLEIGKVDNEKAKQVFLPFGLFNSSGEFTIPVIEEIKGNSLFEISYIIADEIAQQVSLLINLSELKNSFEFVDEEQTLVIAYHEIMWDLLKYFEEQNLIQKPVAFANPDEAESKDISDLVFFIKKINH